MRIVMLSSVTRIVTVLGGTCVLTGCDLSKLGGHQELPTGTSDPSTFHNAAGAQGLYNQTLYTFQSATHLSNDTAASSGVFVDFVLISGVLSDELHAGNLNETFGAKEALDSIDARKLSDETDPSGLYVRLNGVRTLAGQGIEALSTYAPDAPKAQQGLLYSLEGYTEILLADLFCSGIPLSTVSFTGNYAYGIPRTTAQVYAQAAATFDSALALSADSAPILNLARVGKGRALLAGGHYAEAAQAVASVPNDFSYEFTVDWSIGPAQGISLFHSFSDGTGVTVADSEGRNGLPYLASNDPRTHSEVLENAPVKYAPVKYGGALPGPFPIVVASGIEARLIEAEAALQAGNVNAWLQQLNALRTTVGLDTVVDPGTTAARVTLLFQERAYWLFLTGHRQGDLRRLVRQYRRPAAHVYPVGSYPGGLASYGTSVNISVPAQERANTQFHGCFDRGA